MAGPFHNHQLPIMKFPMFLKRQSALIGAIAALLLIGVLVFVFEPPGRQLSAEQERKPSESISDLDTAGFIASVGAERPGLPVRLKIPRIGIDAPIIYVGLTAQGAMDIPKGPAEVAWFDLGPRPGENGNAVIAGHFGWKDNIPAVFDALGTLREGDTVSVERDDGTMAIFIVRALRTYGENENASDVFITSDGRAHLNLVTCSGIWNKAQKSYSTRLVVFADAEQLTSQEKF